MFKSKLLLLTVIASITLVSCQKESLTSMTPKQPSTTDALVKTKTEGNKVETYYYDAQNRVSKIVFSSTTNSDSYYYEYTYNNDMVSEYHSNEALHSFEETNANGVTKLNCTSNPRLLKLDNNGFLKSIASSCEEKTFTYDEAGFMVEQNFAVVDYNRKDQYTNDKRNVTAINGKGFSYVGGEFGATTTFDYYTEKCSIGNKNFGKNFLGKSSENLVKTETQDGKSITYTYSFDAQQRVISKTATSATAQTVTTYTYY